MPKRTCSLDGCEDIHLARGLCRKHYNEYQRNGRELPPTQERENHTITDVNAEARTGTCATHGPDTALQITNRHSARPRYECALRRRDLQRVRRERDRAAGKKQPVPPRRQVIRYVYGLEWDQYQAMLQAQSGRCAICNVVMDGTPCIDHDHETNAVRGLLCKRCNFGIGWFDDTPGKILAAYFYLLAHGRTDLAS